MAEFVVGDTVTDAWLDALEHLRGRGREVFGLVVEIAEPSPRAGDHGIVTALDRLLARRGWQSTETVANTIFPAQLAATARDRAHLYARYRALVPRLRRLPANKRGLYFERLIAYPLQGDAARANQVETVIGDLAAQLARRAPLRSIYEAQLFAPGKDRVPIGFPCLSSLSFQLDGGRLRLTATYRNQYYVRKALGNFLGLAGLQRFVADAVGLAPGPLTVYAFHGQIDPEVGRRDLDELIAACRAAGRPRLPRTHPA